MNICEDVIIPLLIEFFGAFLGILSAIGLSNSNKHQKHNELNQSLKSELIRIKEELIEHIHSGGKDYYRYATPTWDIHMKSGTFNDIDYDKYKKYIDVYSKIEYAQEVEREWTHSVLMADISKIGKAYIDTMNNERLKRAQEIIDAIESLLGGRT